MTHLQNLMDNRSISPPSSITSCSRDSEDLSSKYQRLANQYAQVRAQVVVLKKALLDEREKHSYIKDNDVGKGQKIRTLEQEVDSLTFRNKQLSARVDNLQQELDNLSRKKGKIKPSKQSNDGNKESDSIHFEELESKIRENEILHSKLQTAEERNSLKLQHLEDHNASLLSSKRELENVLKASKEDFENALSKEQRRSSTLQVQVDKLQNKIDSLNAAVLRNKANSSKPGSPALGLEHGAKLVKCKNLNIYAKDKKRAALVENTLEVVGGYVSEIVTHLQNYCTYLEQRTRLHSADLGEPLSLNSQTMCKELLGNTAYIRPLLELWTLFSTSVKHNQYSLKSCSELKVFSSQFTDITEYLIKVFHLQKKSLSEESMSMSCSIQMEGANTTISDTISPLVLALQNTALSLYHVTDIVDSGSASRYIPVLIKDVKELCASLRSHISTLHPKLVLAHKLPSITQRSKTTDECYVASVQAFVNTLTKITGRLDDSLPILTKPSRFSAEQESVYTAHITDTCSDYISLINSSVPVSDTDTTPEHLSPVPSTPSPDITNELTASKEKIAKLEQSKEHWMLEAQLLNIKLEKAQKQLQETSRPVSSPTNNVPVDTLLDLNDNSCSSAQAVVPWDDSGLREEAIRLHYSNRINTLNEAIQKAEGDCVMFKRECTGLKKRIHISEKQQNILAVEVCNADKLKHQLEEELTLTKDKYESQIALMSEHLCAMNDKLVNLNEENLTLKMDTPKQNRKRW